MCVIDGLRRRRRYERPIIRNTVTKINKDARVMTLAPTEENIPSLGDFPKRNPYFSTKNCDSHRVSCVPARFGEEGVRLTPGFVGSLVESNDFRYPVSLCLLSAHEGAQPLVARASLGAIEEVLCAQQRPLA